MINRARIYIYTVGEGHEGASARITYFFDNITPNNIKSGMANIRTAHKYKIILPQ